jgi:hypothetical protein
MVHGVDFFFNGVDSESLSRFYLNGWDKLVSEKKGSSEFIFKML